MPWGAPSLLYNGTGALSLGKSGLIFASTTQPNLNPRLRMMRAVTPLPHLCLLRHVMVYTLMPGQYTFVLLKNNQGFSYVRLSNLSCQGVNMNTVAKRTKLNLIDNILLIQVYTKCLCCSGKFSKIITSESLLYINLHREWIAQSL